MMALRQARLHWLVMFLLVCRVYAEMRVILYRSVQDGERSPFRIWIGLQWGH